MLLFSFMTAAAITAGRLNAAPDREMPIRYALFTSLAQVALLLVVAPSLARLWATGWRRLGQAVVLLGAVLFLGQQILAGRAGAEGAARYTAAYRTLEAGKWSRDRATLRTEEEATRPQAKEDTAHGSLKHEKLYGVWQENEERSCTSQLQ